MVGGRYQGQPRPAERHLHRQRDRGSCASFWAKIALRQRRDDCTTLGTARCDIDATARDPFATALAWLQPRVTSPTAPATRHRPPRNRGVSRQDPMVRVYMASDPATIATLYADEHNPLRRRFLRHGFWAASASDLVQETFIRLLRSQGGRDSGSARLSVPGGRFRRNRSAPVRDAGTPGDRTGCHPE